MSRMFSSRSADPQSSSRETVWDSTEQKFDDFVAALALQPGREAVADELGGERLRGEPTRRSSLD